MTKENKTKQPVLDIDDNDRLENYIRFQIYQADSTLSEFYEVKAEPSCYFHLLKWKKQLENELSDLTDKRHKQRRK